MTTIKINPINLHVAQATDLGFQLTGIEFGKSASFIWHLIGKDGLIIQGNLTMDGEDYQAWNNDDPYVKNWIMQKLNVSEFVEKNNSDTEPNENPEFEDGD